MTELTNQDYFDKTINHIVQQGDACMIGPHCAYRNGTKSCAVGYWIPEGHMANMSTGGVGSLVGKYQDLKGVAWPDTKNGIHLARALQWLHDENIVGTDLFEKEVNKIKFRFTLN
jgi:hypothetical protein